MEKENSHNPTCLITGKRENLQMHAIRNDKGNMTGWIFLHETIDIETLDGAIKWDFKVNVK